MSQCGIRAKLCAGKISLDSSIQAQSTGEVMRRKWRSYRLFDRGAQTQRSLIHFSIGDDHMPKAVYHAYVKKAAALVNAAAGRLYSKLADAIVVAADEVIAGQLERRPHRGHDDGLDVRGAVAV